MRVYVPLHESRGVNRMATALRWSVPFAATLVATAADADMVVFHVVGRRDAIARATARCRARGQRYVIVQYCLRSTMQPSTEAWRAIWSGATLVWSYYDLPALIHEDHGAAVDFPFIHAPMGVEPVFVREPSPRRFLIGTHGTSRLCEGIREAMLAAAAVGGAVCHLGPRFRRYPAVSYVSNVSDAVVAQYWSQCAAVAGLRRGEGFERPAAEGLLAGARPIMFDQPTYRRWFEPWAVFIREGSRAEVVDQLVGIFRRGIQAVTEVEREAARQRFNWLTIVDEFWSRVRR
jgi:hypothetical protein